MKKMTLIHLTMILIAMCGMGFVPSVQANVVYVNHSASGGNDGSSWANAYEDLQNALANASNGAEIWVASGTYTPGTNPDDTFQLITGVEIYGGFGGTESNLEERNLRTHVTTLSGNDVNYHVVTGSGAASSAVLDGFIITKGGKGAAPGGGIYNDGGSPTIRNCALTNNSVMKGIVGYGGGLWNNGDPALINCTFSGNAANGSFASQGGGMFNEGGTPTLTNCTFTNNEAMDGGGLYVKSGTVKIKNTIISDNFSNDYDKGSGNISSSGYNLVKDGSASDFGRTGDIIGTDPGLGALDPNGFHPLTSGSPGINAGTCTGAPGTDQRGVSRPQGDTCDIGAYEYEEETLTPVLSVSPDARNVSETQGTTTFDVENTGGGTLSWTAAANHSWLSVESGASGTNSGTITVRYDANTGAERTGTLTITASGATDSPQTVQVTQAAGSSSETPVLSVTPATQNVSAGTSTATFTVGNSGGGTLSWIAISLDDSWLSVESGSSGTGSGTITVRYDANTGGERTGTIRVTASGATGSPQTVQVVQAAGSSSETPVLSVTPATQNVSAGTSTATFTVGNSGGGTLSWIAIPLDSWLFVESGDSGTGSGTITVRYDANTGGERTGSIRVTATGATGSPRTVQVTQAAGSSSETPVLSVTPATQNVSKSGGTTAFIVENAGTGTMTWTAVSSAAWLTIDSGASGTNAGTISVRYEANTGDERNGILTITAASVANSPQYVSVKQAAGADGNPVLSITPAIQDVSGESGTTTFTIGNTGTGTMSWTAVSNAAWLTIDSGASGTNAGTITISHTANPGSERVGTITVTAEGAAESPAFAAVRQAASDEDVPVLSLTPAIQNASGESGTTTFIVTNAGPGTMNWTAASEDSWLTIISGTSGTNTGTVTVSYGANSGETERIGTLTITAAGATGSPQTVQVVQAGTSPDMPILSVTPTSQNVSKSSGTTSFVVSNAGPGTMNWIASPGASWLTIISGTSGTNTGSVTVSHGTNPGETQRTGTLTITASGATGSPQTVQVVQAGTSSEAPALSVTPDFREVSESSGTATFVVSNAGTGTMTWAAVSDAAWLNIITGNSGTDSGLIDVQYNANTGTQRTGTLTITAVGAAGSPKTVQVRQQGSGAANQNPSDIALSKASVEENLFIGYKIGTFSTTDPDSGDTHTYQLVSGAGSEDNGSFAISGVDLKTNEIFNYNTKNNYTIRVETNDGNGGTFQKQFVITITNANDAPTNIILSNSSVPEDISVGADVGTLATTDADPDDTHTYTLLVSDNAAFRISENMLKTNKALDFETKDTYAIWVKTDDGRGGTYEKDFAISVIDANDPPSDIALSHNIITEGMAMGTVVGTFAATDQDAGDTHAYDLIPGSGDDDNDSFLIEYGRLKTNQEFDYDTQAQHTIRVRATDSQGASYDKSFAILVTAAPTVTYDPADGKKGIAVDTKIVITFSKPVRRIDDSPINNVNVDELITFRKTNENGDDILFDATINGGKTAITIYPNDDLESTQTYYVALGATVEDEENNAVTPTSATFATVDTEPPTVAYDPEDGSENVSTDSCIRINFSEPVNFEDGWGITNANVHSLITFRKDGAGGVSVMYDASIDTRKMTITIRPTADMESNGAYYVAVEPVADTSGNAMKSTNISFTTAPIFSDILADLTDLSRSSGVWGDYDNDGDLDILLSGYDHDNSEGITKVYENDNGRFMDIHADLSGAYFGSVAWGDYDGDNDLDILVTGSGNSEESITSVYEYENRTFIDIGAGLPGVFQSDAAWGDYDDDGDLDILLAGAYEAEGGLPKGIARVYRNDDTKAFTNIDIPLKGVIYAAAIWGDYDNDGDLDILLVGQSDVERISKVYENISGEFSDIGADLIGVSSGCATWGDYDGDGDLDILLTGKYEKEGNIIESISKVYENDGGTFTDIFAFLPGVYNSAVAWGDYDKDGDLDILLAGDDGENKIAEVYENDGGEFSAIHAGLTDVGNGSVAWGDYDGDGYPDILLTGDDGLNRISKIYHNNLGNPKDDDRNELGNAIMALKIVAGLRSEYYDDINGDEKIGMAEVLYHLRRAAGM